ncbi:MAG: hypothetical protein K6E53_05680, partial [Lachnospiraceae bacterium]|nr:hypothetical protein [Lachnospiraceae bacterium]
MMISPKTYIETLKKDSYEELILKRDHLMDSIRQFEELERKGDHSGKEWRINPSPEVRYQSNLDYLSELCAFM